MDPVNEPAPYSVPVGLKKNRAYFWSGVAFSSANSEGSLTKYRELQHLRVADLSAKVLDSLETELPELNPEQKIKLLGVLTRSEAQFKEKDN